MSTPVFSVVIPVYNKGPHIHRSISSVLQQNFKDFELIIVNDPSVDNSLDEVKKFTDQRIKLLYRNEPGPGGYAARNMGIQEANGKWVAFLDADDEWLPDHLTNIYSQLLKHKDVKCFINAWAVSTGHGAPTKHIVYTGSNPININFDEFLRLGINNKCPIFTSAVVINKDYLVEKGMFPAGKYQRGGDTDTWLRVMEGTDCVWNPEVCVIYHKDSVNMTSKIYPDQVHPPYETVFNMLHNSAYSFRRKILLKQFSNFYTRNVILKMITFGEKNRAPIRYYFFPLTHFDTWHYVLFYFCQIK